MPAQRAQMQGTGGRRELNKLTGWIGLNKNSAFVHVRESPGCRRSFGESLQVNRIVSKDALYEIEIFANRDEKCATNVRFPRRVAVAA
jgi:hypothetical protein